jgi:hypothetical protein
MPAFARALIVVSQAPSFPVRNGSSISRAISVRGSYRSNTYKCTEGHRGVIAQRNPHSGWEQGATVAERLVSVGSAGSPATATPSYRVLSAEVGEKAR